MQINTDRSSFKAVFICVFIHLPSPDVSPCAGSMLLSGVVFCFSQKGTFLFPVYSLVLHVHLKRYEMHMSYCSTCTCRTALHVHLKQRCILRLLTFLYKIELYQYRRRKQRAAAEAIKLKAIQYFTTEVAEDTEFKSLLKRR